MQIFCAKEYKRPMLPQANRASIGSNARFEYAPRKSCFSQTFGSQSQMFVKKIKEYHAAAGESGFHLVKRPV
jgi:hypothetical protein